MTASDDTLNPWVVSSCLGGIQSHSLFECKCEHGEIGTGNGDLVQDKRKNGRVDENGLAQQNKHTRPQTRRDRLGETLHRVTTDARSRDTISIEDATNIDRDEEHILVEERPRDLVTVLLLKSVSVQDDHLVAYDKQGDKIWALMHRGNRRQPVAAYNNWAHETRGVRRRDQLQNLLCAVTISIVYATQREDGNNSRVLGREIDEMI